MVQLINESINLLNLVLKEKEIEKVVELWYPQARDNVISIKDSQVYILQSVNTQTEFVTIRVNEIQQLTISFHEMKENYLPLLTFSQVKELIKQVPPEYEGLKEKLKQIPFAWED